MKKMMIQHHILMLLAAMCLVLGGAVPAAAQERAARPPICHGWYVQAGLDMTLQNPYGSPEGSTFREGRTQGIVVGLGRWFTPAIGLRGRINWENGFPPLSNRKATWLNFLDESKGLNADHGGYISVVGDVQLDIQGIIWPDRDDLFWHCQVFPRAGFVYNCGLHKGSPLIGAGIGNTFRLNRRCKIFLDVAYQMVSSGFNGQWTDLGSGANAYLDITAGIQINLGRL